MSSESLVISAGVNGGKLNRQGLTLKQARFVHYYIKTSGNGYKAAQYAGYNGRMNTLAAIASQNLNKIKVQSELKRRMSKVLTSNEVLEKLSDVADAEVKLNGSDKLKALELLGKSHKLFTDRIESRDLTEEAKPFREYLLQKIAQHAMRSGLSEADAALEFHRHFSDRSSVAYDEETVEVLTEICSSLQVTEPTEVKSIQ